MKRHHLLLAFGALLMLHAACPTKEPPAPPRLQAPVITGIEVSGELVAGEYKEIIEIRWIPPSQDSVRITSYTLLRCESSSGESTRDFSCPTNYSIVNQAIAPEETRFLDRADRIGFPLPSSFSAYKPLNYRILAIDELGRSGDTSTPVLLTLAPQAQSVRIPDSAHPGRFSWEVLGIATQYFTRVHLWHAADGLVWTSRTDSTYGHAEYSVRHTKTLPDSLLPLKPGNYFCGITIRAVGGFDYPQSIFITEMRVQ